MDIGKSFTFVFEDEAWLTKILIMAVILFLGVLLSLVLIPAIVAAALINGYMVEIIRNVLRGQLDELPEWDNWGALIVDGLKVIVIQIVYALPAIIVGLCLSIAMMAVAGTKGEWLVILLSVVMSCLILLWAIVVSILLPAATAIFAATNDLAAAFHFGEVFALVRDNLSTYLITFIMSWVASFIGGLGSIAFLVGAFITGAYGYMVTGHLYGQAYLASTATASQADLEELTE